MQRLNVELSIEIPAEYVLITKVEYYEDPFKDYRLNLDEIVSVTIVD